MKKVIRLTESDLVRIVKRVINESETAATGGAKPVSTENGKNAFKLIKAGVDGNNKDTMAKGIYTIKTKEDYDTVMRHIHKYIGKYPTILGYLASVWEKVSQGSNLFGIWSSSNNWLSDLERHLYQFNTNESAATTSAMGNSPGRTFNDGTFKPRN
jgi:hypothetical protein